MYFKCIGLVESNIKCSFVFTRIYLMADIQYHFVCIDFNGTVSPLALD